MAAWECLCEEFLEKSRLSVRNNLENGYSRAHSKPVNPVITYRNPRIATLRLGIFCVGMSSFGNKSLLSWDPATIGLRLNRESESLIIPLSSPSEV